MFNLAGKPLHNQLSSFVGKQWMHWGDLANCLQLPG